MLTFGKQEFPQAISQKEKDYFIDLASESLERNRIKLPKSKIQEKLCISENTVLDYTEANIKVFKKDGDYLKTIVRKVGLNALGVIWFYLIL